MKTSKNLDYYLLLLWNIPAFFLALHFGTNYIITAFIITGLPAIYITIKKPALFKKIAIMSILPSIVGASIFSYLAHLDGSWYNPSIFPRIFGTYPFEDFVWAFMYFYYLLSFYEYFYEKEKLLKFPKHFQKSFKILLLIAIVFSIGVYFSHNTIIIPYFYAFQLLIFFVLLPWLILSKHQSLIIKSIKVAIFFLAPHFIGEYIAAVNHNWWFPGHHFIGYISALGITIPIEEFLWLLLVVPAAIAYYEFLADDEK